ncbi:MAG: hypothetical protein H7144_15735, partial [Burkholderiales bacterium]|nr:hypothetical protein [Phycisphaerae bacterium]
GRPLDGPETLLTLNDQKAVDTGLAKSIVVNAETLAAERGWVVVGSLAPGAGDKLVSVLSGAAVRGIVFSILMLSLYAALHSPGTGGPEAIALTALGILVGVPMLTGYAQWWEVLAIVAGLGLIAVELFVLPGFGIAGITGLVLLLGGLILTFVGNVPGLPGSWRMPQIMTGVRTGLIVVASAIAASFLLSLWLRQYLPKLPYFSRLILNTTAGATTTTAVGSAPAGEAADVWPFIGTFGLAVSDLRPGGSAEFPYADDKRVAAVVSEGGFIRAGTRLAVREVRGSRIIVRPAEG